jgi:hypothetical protein
MKGLNERPEGPFRGALRAFKPSGQAPELLMVQIFMKKKNIYYLKVLFFIIYLFSMIFAQFHVHDCGAGQDNPADCLICDYLHISFSFFWLVFTGFIITLHLSECVDLVSVRPAGLFIERFFRNKAPPVSAAV